MDNMELRQRTERWQVLAPPAEQRAPAPLAEQLELATAIMREAIRNQELTGLLIGAQRLFNLARAHRFGPLAWHAAAVAAMCSERPEDTKRMAELMAGLELALGAAFIRIDPAGGV
jgi:hypothetical protein